MNYIKLSIIPLILLLSFNVYAVDCYGVPSFVKMVEYGAQESYVIVRMGDKDYRLGNATDDAAKIRLSIALTALVANKEVKLRFYSEDTCITASNNRTIPNSFQLVK